MRLAIGWHTAFANLLACQLVLGSLDGAVVHCISQEEKRMMYIEAVEIYLLLRRKINRILVNGAVVHCGFQQHNTTVQGGFGQNVTQKSPCTLVSGRKSYS